MDPDDAAYKKSVRNMSVVLAAMAVVVVATLLIPPLLFPAKEGFQPSVSLNSPFGFALHLKINSTSSSGSGVLIWAWLNSTSPGLDNVTTGAAWGVDPGDLYRTPCAVGWPIGIGVMRGHYDQYNYTLGTMIPLYSASPGCRPSPAGSPSYFILEPHSSRVLVDVSGTPEYWTIQTRYAFGYAAGEGLQTGVGPGLLPAGVYTVVVADEWGDVLTTNFLVS